MTESNNQPKPFEVAPNPIDSGVDIGHVHMKAGNLQKIEDFYVGVLGFNIMTRLPEAIFISAGGYHHHLAFNTWQSKGGAPASAIHTGLYHIAIRYPSKKTLADALKRLNDADYQIDGLSDHGTQLSLYLRDPEENGLELYWDRPREEWPLDNNGRIDFSNKFFDLSKLLQELNE